MSFKIITAVLFFILTSFVGFSQIRDTSKLTSDQNPNFQKSKDKYTKPKTEGSPTVITTNTQVVSIPKDTISTLTHLPVELAPAKITLESIQSQLKLAEKNNNQLAIAEALNNLGKYYLNSKKWGTALENFQKSLSISSSYKNQKGILESLLAIANCYRMQKNDAKAEVYYLQGLTLAKELKSSEKIKIASNALSELYASKGNYKNAFEMQVLFKQITDSLYKKETENAFIKSEFAKQQVIDSIEQNESRKTYLKDISGKELELSSSRKISYLILIGLILSVILAGMFYRSYQLTKKSNKMIALQKLDAEEKKVIIEKSLEEKEILLKEIHHRVKNNLQIISSLLSLQANRTEDEGLKRTMTEAKNRIASMALIHQKIYQSDNLSSIDFQSYVEQMANSIDSTFNTEKKKITYTINTNGIVLDIDTAIPLGLIINELLTNCYKYAFLNRLEGKVDISLREVNPNEIEFHISDDGLGIPANLNVSSLKSLGLKLVKGLADQIKGTFKFENNNGAHFFITFKKTNT